LSIADALRSGLRRPDRGGVGVHYRLLRDSDDVDAITALLHAAYAPLAAGGMRFVASHQDASVTLRRMSRGDTIVAERDGRLVGIVTLASPENTGGTPHYDRVDVASFGQFAVAPGEQRAGIGSTLIEIIETLAAERGAAELSLDTSEHASGLIAFYRKRGFQFVGHHRWESVNYRSVVLSKRLSAGPGREPDRA
jgi:GNAT superfamily N-acetyltransferase